VKKVPGNSHQNGVAERMNMIILERAWSIQIHAGLSKQFWADAVNMMVYLINRRPSVSLNCRFLEEAWTSKEINLNHLRTFDCISYIYIELSHRSKLNPKFRRCIFIGYRTNEYD